MRTDIVTSKLVIALSMTLASPALGESDGRAGQVVQANGFLHEAQSDCEGISEDAFDKWRQTVGDDSFNQVTAVTGKGEAFVLYELGKQRFSLAFAYDPEKACASALRVISGEASVPELDGIPPAPHNDDKTTRAFLMLGMADALYKQCSEIMDASLGTLAPTAWW